ncbi:hypothetical protein JXM83_01260 [Candidatus Woesearchaeota archaeon]|nr:hypothetical protein [Candidatus Woesearchaeota archaeon]
MQILLIESVVLFLLIFVGVLYYFLKYRDFKLDYVAVCLGFLFLAILIFNIFSVRMIFSEAPMYYNSDFIAISNGVDTSISGTHLGGAYYLFVVLYGLFGIENFFQSVMLIKIVVILSLIFMFVLLNYIFKFFMDKKYKKFSSAFSVILLSLSPSFFMISDFKFYYIFSFVFLLLSFFFLIESWNSSNHRHKFSLILFFISLLFAIQSRPELAVFSIYFLLLDYFRSKKINPFLIMVSGISILIFSFFMKFYGVNLIFRESLIAILVKNLIMSRFVICLFILIFLFGFLFKKLNLYYLKSSLLFLLLFFAISFSSVKYDKFLFSFYSLVVFFIGIISILNCFVNKNYLVKSLLIIVTLFFMVMFVVNFNHIKSRAESSYQNYEFIEQNISEVYALYLYPYYKFMLSSHIKLDYWIIPLLENKSSFVYAFYSGSGDCSNEYVELDFERMLSSLNGVDLQSFLIARKYPTNLLNASLDFFENGFTFLEHFNSESLFSSRGFNVCNITIYNS